MAADVAKGRRCGGDFRGLGLRKKSCAISNRSSVLVWISVVAVRPLGRTAATPSDGQQEVELIARWGMGKGAVAMG